MDYFDKRDYVPPYEDGNDSFPHQFLNEGSEILEFYENKNILVTDASELGVLLIDRLLRSCPKIGTIYLLMKPAKKKTHIERNDEYFFSECCDTFDGECITELIRNNNFPNQIKYYVKQFILESKMVTIPSKIILITAGHPLANGIIIQQMMILDAITAPKFCYLEKKREVYDKINQTHQYLKKKLKIVHGDYTQPYCGISKYDQKILTDEVQIVFHCTGSNKYDSLKSLCCNNIQSTKSLLELGCKMKNLKAFIYVSSIRAKLFQPDIEEKFHERIFSAKNSKSWEEQLQMIAPKIVGRRGELSDFTKAVAEQVAREYDRKIPVAIARSQERYKENHTFNWKQFFNMSTETHSTLISALKYYEHGINDDAMPADNFINTIVAISWKIGTDKSERIDINTPEYDMTPSWNSRIPTNWEEHLTEDSNLIYQAISKQSLIINKPPVNNHKRENYQKQHVYAVLVLLMLNLYLKIYCNIYKLMNTLVETINFNSFPEYYHSQAQSSKPSNLDKLWSSMTNADKKLFKFNIINNERNRCSSRNIRNMIAYLFQEDLSDLGMSNKNYDRYQQTKMYLKILLYIASAYFIINSIYFLYLVKYCNMLFL